MYGMRSPVPAESRPEMSMYDTRNAEYTDTLGSFGSVTTREYRSVRACVVMEIISVSDAAVS